MGQHPQPQGQHPSRDMLPYTKGACPGGGSTPSPHSGVQDPCLTPGAPVLGQDTATVRGDKDHPPALGRLSSHWGTSPSTTCPWSSPHIVPHSASPWGSQPGGKGLRPGGREPMPPSQAAPTGNGPSIQAPTEPPRATALPQTPRVQRGAPEQGPAGGCCPPTTDGPAPGNATGLY